MKVNDILNVTVYPTDEQREEMKCFQDELSAELGRTFQDHLRAGPEEVKASITRTLMGNFEALGLKIPKINAEVLWKSMGLERKILWWVFHCWPLSLFAQQHRKEVDELNRLRWKAELERENDESDIEVFLPLVEYKDIFNPHPKSVVIFRVQVIAPIN